MIKIKNIIGDVIYRYDGDTLERADLSYKSLVNANLKGTNLMCANLKGANLSYANLNGADLSHTDLTGANLSHADLNGADLEYADLHSADLTDANLKGANLYSAYLMRANLSGANLSWANLKSAILKLANLSCSDLHSADLFYAKLEGANFRYANLNSANIDSVFYDESTAFFALVCPEEGSFIGFKKVDYYIIKLEIPADAERSSATSRKCRCSKAKVLGIYDLGHNLLDRQSVVNTNYVITEYKVGEMVYPDGWDSNRWKECSHGIHFFMTFDEAAQYNC